MITCNLMGGLGNQLFEIFTTISYAIKTKKNFFFINKDKLGDGENVTIRYTYWNTLLSELQPFLVHEIQSNDNIVMIREKDFTFNELLLDEIIDKNNNENYNENHNEILMIVGHFQSYKYFNNYYKEIYELLEISKYRDNLLKKLNKITNNTNKITLNLYNLYFFKYSISIHFRIGDYKKAQHFHPILNINYYIKSLKYIQSMYPHINFNILYFYEVEDTNVVNTMIKELKNIFIDYNFISGEKNIEDWEQLLLMSCCHHNIIANSSFSWWAGYFNTYTNKIVCYPSIWFNIKDKNYMKDLCPLEWIKIEID